MKVELTQKELLQILNEKFNSNVKINDVLIRIKLKNGFTDYILFKEEDYYFGSFIEKELVEKINKGENNGV